MTTNRHRVMVVDDELEITRALRRILRDTYDVETALNGAEALEKLEAFRPDVVISDFRMPNMNGAELLGEVKRRMPLSLRLILSGNADLDAVLASVNTGEICRFLRKPWDSEQLLALLARLLEDRQILNTLYQPFSAAQMATGAIVAEAVHESSRLVVNARLTGKPFAAEQAICLIAKVADALEASQLKLVGGLLERHAGKVSFVAEVGGEQKLTLELPLRGPEARSAEDVS